MATLFIELECNSIAEAADILERIHEDGDLQEEVDKLEPGECLFTNFGAVTKQE